MRNRIKYISLIILVGIFNLRLKGQSPSDPDFKDFGMWLGGKLSYKLNHWTFQGRQEFRTENNSTALDKLFTQVGIKYKLYNKMDLAAAIRYTGINDNEGKVREYENHFRYQAAIHYHAYRKKKKRDHIRFHYRLQYQRQSEIGKGELQGSFPRTAWRLRTAVNYNIKKWKLDPQLSYELFFHKQVGSFTAFKFFTGFTRFRIKLETNYKLNKSSKLNFFILKQKENIIWRPPTEFMLGCRYVYRILND